MLEKDRAQRYNNGEDPYGNGLPHPSGIFSFRRFWIEEWIPSDLKNYTFSDRRFYSFQE